MEKRLNVVLLVTFVCFSVASYDELEVGSGCENSETPGICRSVTECPIAIDALRKYHKHNLKRCGFVGLDEIVCCPLNGVRGNDNLLYIQMFGSSCENSETPGICRSVAECPIAIEALRKYHKHNLKRCGFVGLDEIVCCPSNGIRGSDTLQPFTDSDGGSSEESTPSTDAKGQFPKRKYQQACEAVEFDSRTNIIFHITDGEDAKQKEFPHMAALGFDNDENNNLDWNCGACLISNRFLVTAAHCVTRKLPVRARLGITWLNDTNPVDVDIRKVTMYNPYDPISKHGDIALVELANNVSFNDKIKPACLYAGHDDPLGLIVTGWGKTSVNNEDDRSNILQKAKLVAIPIERCNTTYVTTSLGTRTIDSSQICAWGNSSDACWGDSGGPLQKMEKSGYFSIVGIVSYGAGCGGKIPGVYTRVSRYIDWIENTVWP